jgi:glycosyltransferase involved in cell wall biosynthesis
LPKITVYIVTKNRLSQLKDAIKSVEAQTYRDFALIVVDDGSTDGTGDYLRAYNPSFDYRFFRNETSVGAPKSRNAAINNAEGEFITGLDDDDTFLPNRLQEFITAWKPDVAAIGAEDLLITDSKIIRWRKPAVVSHDDLLFRNLVGNQVFTRTDYLKNLGGFDEELSASQDYDLWIRLSERYGPIEIIQKPLQKVSFSTSIDRISNSKNRAWGYFACYQKHKQKMSREQRKYHLYLVKRSLREQTRWMSIFGWVPAKYWVKEFAKQFLGT